MTKASLVRTASQAALIVMTLLGYSSPVIAADPPAGRVYVPAVQIYGDKSAQFLPLGIGKSVVVDLPGDVKDILVAGNDSTTFSYLENNAPFALLGLGSTSAAVSVVAPSLLIDDLELTKIDDELPKLPIVPSPLSASK